MFFKHKIRNDWQFWNLLTNVDKFQMVICLTYCDPFPGVYVMCARTPKPNVAIYAWLACVSCTSDRGVTATTVMHLQSIIHPSVISCKVVDIWQLCPYYPLSILHSQTILALFLTISNSELLFLQKEATVNILPLLVTWLFVGSL